MAHHPTIYRSATTGNVRLEIGTASGRSITRRITEEGSSAEEDLSLQGVIVMVASGVLLLSPLPWRSCCPGGFRLLGRAGSIVALDR